MDWSEEKPLGQIVRESRERMNMPIWELASLIGIDRDMLERFEAESILLEKKVYFQLCMYLKLSPIFAVRALGQFDETPEQQAKTTEWLASARTIQIDRDQAFRDMIGMIDKLSPEKQDTFAEIFDLVNEFSRQRDQYKQRED